MFYFMTFLFTLLSAPLSLMSRSTNRLKGGSTVFNPHDFAIVNVFEKSMPFFLQNVLRDSD